MSSITTVAMFKPESLFNLQQTEHAVLFKGKEWAWEAVSEIADYIKTHLKPAVHAEIVGAPYIGKDVYIGEGARVEPGACILGPAIIGSNCIVRHGAYVRENVIVGDGCVIGNSCEFKNCLLFNEVQVPHFSYVGDSILGYKAHLGAGVIVSNLKLNKTPIDIYYEGQTYRTNMKKLGAIVGDECEVGSNSVLNPGTILGRQSILYPGAIWKGVLPEASIARSITEYKIVPRRMR